MRALLTVLGLALASCGGDSKKPPPAPDGERVYAAQGCALCHGGDGSGTALGPTLHGKAPHWTRENLVLYLKAPIAYAEKDPRLAEQKKKYSLPMRQFDHVPEAELGAVADYVLGLP